MVDALARVHRILVIFLAFLSLVTEDTILSCWTWHICKFPCRSIWKWWWRWQWCLLVGLAQVAYEHFQSFYHSSAKYHLNLNVHNLLIKLNNISDILSPYSDDHLHKWWNDQLLKNKTRRAFGITMDNYMDNYTMSHRPTLFYTVVKPQFTPPWSHESPSVRQLTMCCTVMFCVLCCCTDTLFSWAE